MGKSDHFDKDWEDLTGKQQKAATIMGWDEITWCIDYDEYEEEMEERREYYPEYDWNELPSKAQTAATLFGFTQKKWDHDIPVMGMDEEWDDLSVELQAAAQTLGYDKKIWCADFEKCEEKEEAVNW